MAKKATTPEADASGAATGVKRERAPRATKPPKATEETTDADKAPETAPPTEADPVLDIDPLLAALNAANAQVQPEQAVPVEKPRVHKVESESEAVEHFHKEGYTLPEGEPFAWVTADGNVFFKDGQASGAAHARQFKLPYYQIQP